MTTSGTGPHPGPGGGAWPDIAAGYDEVARDYGEHFADELDAKPFDRRLLTRFAAALEAGGHPGPVADLGCGPAHVGAFLADLGCPVVGVDLSPAMVDEARRRHPAIDVHQGDLRHLPLPDGALAGAACFYALIHLARAEAAAALAEMTRVLAPGGQLLVAVHAGTGELRRHEFLGHPVELAATLFELDELAGLATGAGLEVVEQHQRPPYEQESTTRLYLWARRP